MKKILMIDDDEEMCHEMCDALTGNSYQVEYVHCGEVGLTKAMSGEYSVVLLDLKMTGMGGRKVLEALKAKNPAIKVMVLTGSPVSPAILGMPDVEELNPVFNNVCGYDVEVLRLADCVMNKPFDVARVIRKIDEFCR